MINTSGIIASYPTSLPFHTQSAFHGDGLATIIEACHEADIKVIARTDSRRSGWPFTSSIPSGLSPSRRRDRRGRRRVGLPLRRLPAECAPRIVEETTSPSWTSTASSSTWPVRTHDYRGIEHGICHCDACVEGFRAASGQGAPHRLGHRGSDLSAVRRLHERGSSKQRMDATIAGCGRSRDRRPTDDGGGFVRQESNTALHRPLPDWQYSASANTKWVVSSLPCTVSSNASVDFVDYPVRHVAVSPARQRLRLAQALANGGGLDFMMAGWTVATDRTGTAVRELFGFHAGA